MMANESYDNLPRGAGEANYFEATDPRSYSSQFTAEPRDTNTRSPAASNARREHDYSAAEIRHMQPSVVDEAHNLPIEAEPIPAPSTVSPELIAELTERIKKEVVEHLKQTGTIETPTEQSTLPPLQRPSPKSSTTSSPPPTDRKIYTPPSPNTSKPAGKFPASPTMGPRRSPPESPGTEKSSVRFTASRKPSDDGYDEKENIKRPSAAARTFSTIELSTIDQKWGRLFEGEHTATSRLEQFLKGLANHIVEEYEPKKSIVVTPEKMAQFYSNHPLPTEIHPMTSIFKSQKNKQLSGLYKDLCCQQHLVQETPDQYPSIPGLTPYGFAQWMTIAILAHPNEEAQRLNDVVLALPIDADGQMVDGKPERLPKQISRHLLPNREHRKSRQQFDDAIADFLEYAEKASLPRRRSTIPSPPVSRRQSLTTPANIESPLPSPLANQIERERMPYGGTPSCPSETSTVEDVATGIERERKPYIAQPGAGKIYADTINLSAPPAGHQRRSRANSAPRDEDYVSHGDTRYPRSSAQRSGGARHRQSSPPLRGFRTSEPVLDTSGGYAPSLSSATSAPIGYKNFSPAAAYTSSSASLNVPIPPPPSAGYESRDRNASAGSEPRDRDRDRERERDRDRDRERERDRARDRDRERERDRDRDRERERDRERDRKSRSGATESHLPTRRGTEDGMDSSRLSFTSPRDAERYDRMHDGRSVGSDSRSERGSVAGGSYEDYYRDGRDRERDRGARSRGRDLDL